MNTPEPRPSRDPGTLAARMDCPLDGTPMQVTRMGLWECAALLHQWHRFGRDGGQPGAWKLLRTFRPKSIATKERQRFG